MSLAHKKPRIAILGGGPAGLVAAKTLLEESLQPVLFEQSSALGGQWHAPASHSGVWSNMRTNTSKITTCFSDFPHADHVSMFPTNQQMHAYLLQYAERFDLHKYVRLHSRVDMVQWGEDGNWLVRSTTRSASSQVERFSHVIVASGRFNKPHMPPLTGIETFTGAGGLSHTFDYQGNAPFKGQRVLVIGNSISGLEVASDMAVDPTITVLSSCRKPRYIVTKILGGMPTDCAVFTRFATLLNQVLPPEAAAQGLKELILTQCGNPAQYGGLEPVEDLFEANISQCQYYLAHVAEGKIRPKRAAVEVAADRVIFADDSQEQIDAIVCGTGYALHLPFLSDDILRVVHADDTHMDLYRHTFHPDLPQLAFLGLYDQIGPYFPVLELQARWVAMTWSDVQPLPSRAQMMAGIREFQAWKKMHKETLFHEMAMTLSQEAGVTPQLHKHPELARALLFGPLAPSQFRLDGHGQREDAGKAFAVAASAFGCITSPALSDAQMAGLVMVARAMPEDTSLAALLSMLQEATGQR